MVQIQLYIYINYLNIHPIKRNWFQNIEFLAFNVQTEVVDGGQVCSKQQRHEREALNLRNVYAVVPILLHILFTQYLTYEMLSLENNLERNKQYLNAYLDIFVYTNV